jgi:hypothetical protein
MEKVLDWIKAVGPIILAWPTVVIVFVFLFRQPLLNILKQLGSADRIRAKIGPVELERELKSLAEQGHQAVSGLNRLSQLMAESRLLELEITYTKFRQVFTDEQRERMEAHIAELRNLTSQQDL